MADGKRERLISAAAQLFWTQGYPATSLAEIARAADVPLGNVYYYFKTKAAFADAVAALVDDHLATLERQAIAGRSWADNGCIIVVEHLDQAPPLIDRVAPEHLQLAVEDPEPLYAAVRNAGAVFLGRLTPEAIGDYVAGPNHVLPTARSARFSSGLGVIDFMKRTTLVGCDAAGLAAIGPAAVTLAEAEGLGAHARSVAIRLNRPRAP